MPELNESQSAAVRARGNVLVMAGAGTGKTRTLVERCVARVLDPASPASVDRFLIVTFTEAAAAEMRRRLRERLDAARARRPRDARLAEQTALLDTAEIGTLHAFCARLVREHFAPLGLDPALTVLDEGQAAVLRHERLDALFEQRYADEGPVGDGFRHLVRTLGRGDDGAIRRLVLRLYDYARSLPEPDAWLARQAAQWEPSTPPANWLTALPPAFDRWRREWRSEIERGAGEDPRVAGLVEAFAASRPLASLAEARDLFRRIIAAREKRFGRKRKFPPAVEPLAEEAEAFLAGLGEEPDAPALAEDYALARPAMRALIGLVRAFAEQFAAAKREAAALDFSDLEQFALRLLWDAKTNGPTPLACQLRRRFDHVLVDEYQDINAAQDRLITALSREGPEADRFLVGDLKQSIYGFRLANPKLFRGYAEAWRRGPGTVITLRDNYRSRPELLAFTNAVFAALMRPEVGGVPFAEDAHLRSGRSDRAAPADDAPVELLLSVAPSDADAEAEGGEPSPAELSALEREAAAVADRLRTLRDEGFSVPDGAGARPVRWSDMVVLLRSLSGQAETYAKIFEQKGIPLLAARGGLYATLESRDLLNLLRVLDNPLQDLPLLAVLRSPFAGLDVNELALIRSDQPAGLFWPALRAFVRTTAPSGEAPELAAWRESAVRKTRDLLARLARWRELARQTPLSECLGEILAETRYEEWLRARPRGEQRHANVRRFVALARQFDPWQRQGLLRFLRFVEARLEAEADPEPGVVEADGPVRLLSIHRSKGLEFPVVVVAGLGRRFNLQDQREPVLENDSFGLCPRLDPPDAPPYPSLPLLLARREQAAAVRGEELRLLYVALTRAAEKLILAGSVKLEPAAEKWADPPAPPWPEHRLRAARCRFRAVRLRHSPGRAQARRW
jgi:ATP-dependent helicase/nuclease subunit A